MNNSNSTTRIVHKKWGTYVSTPPTPCFFTNNTGSPLALWIQKQRHR